MDTNVSISVTSADNPGTRSNRYRGDSGHASYRGYLRTGTVAPVCIAVVYILAFGPIAAWYALYGNYGAQFGPPPWHYDLTRIIYCPVDVVVRIPGGEAMVLSYIHWWEDIYDPQPSHQPGLYWDPRIPCVGYR